MTNTSPLEDLLAGRVLEYLGLAPAAAPNLALLERLVDAYTRKVPWESASRIARRVRLIEIRNPPASDGFPRWPVEYWIEAIEFGSGGTCFESNYAFFTLLLALGYDGYLTINNMGDAIACHSAIVVKVMGRSWLVDAGYPVYAPLPLNPLEVTYRESAFHRYTIRPDGVDSFQVERDRHPDKYCFTLINSPVADETYRSITTADYRPGGLFLDRVVITKVIGDSVWRFNSGQRPFSMERFQEGLKTEYPLEDQEGGLDSLAQSIAERFKMPASTIRMALAALS